jgi:hypothetical protein
MVIRHKDRYGCLFFPLVFFFVSCKCLHPRLDRTKRKHTYNTQSLQRWCHFILPFFFLSLSFLFSPFFFTLYLNESKHIHTYTTDLIEYTHICIILYYIIYIYIIYHWMIRTLLFYFVLANHSFSFRFEKKISLI